MQIFTRLQSLWWNLVHRGRVDAALDDELRAYVDLLAAEYEKGGMSPAEARRAALVEAGGVEQVKEATRDAWAGAAISSMGRELRYAIRALRRSPTFVLISIVTLAIGIGGATAVFTVIKASLLRPLPGVSEPHRLVTVERVDKGVQIAELSYPDYRDLASQMTTLTGLAGFNGTSMAVEDSVGSEREWVSYVTENFFTVLGVKPAAGRVFTSADTRAPEGALLAVLGHALWVSRFGASPNIIGTRIKLNGTAFTVIGVAPPGFVGGMITHRMEIFIPIAAGGVSSPVAQFDLKSRRDDPLRLVGRLAPGKGIDDAQRDLTIIAARMAAQYPETNRDRTALALPRTGMTADERADLSRVPRLLSIAVALLLLIACANIASLSLVRAAARRRELSTRVALGASRGALIRQVALEGTLIAAGAGVLGVIVAWLLVRSATLVNTVVRMSDMDLSLDRRVLVVALAASALTALIVSIMPAMQIFYLAPGEVLKAGGGGAVRRSLRGQRALVVAQIAASLVMLSGTAMIYNAFNHVLRAHDGFEPAGLIDLSLDTERARTDTGSQVAFFREVLARAAADPTVAEAALTTTVPPFQWSGSLLVFRRGEAPPPGSTVEQRARVGIRVNRIQISDGFFRVMRIPMIGGRQFGPSDSPRSEPVAIVSRRLAQVLWPGQNPIGREIEWPPIEGPPRPVLRVIGVAENTQDPSLASEAPLAMYLPISQRPAAELILIARGRAGAPFSQAAVRQLIASIDPNVVVLGGQTLNDRLRSHVKPQRTAAAWIGVFAAIALLLAAIGLYGVIAQSVIQRTRELAVRAALGATPAAVLGRVLGDGLRLSIAGTIVGVIASIATVRALGSVFSGIQAGDPRPQVIAMAILCLAALIASSVPGIRAARRNPAEALRAD